MECTGVHGIQSLSSLLSVLVTTSVGLLGMGFALLSMSVNQSRIAGVDGVDNPGSILGGVKGLSGCARLRLLCLDIHRIQIMGDVLALTLVLVLTATSSLPWIFSGAWG